MKKKKFKYVKTINSNYLTPLSNFVSHFCFLKVKSSRSLVIPNRATFDYSYSVSSIRSNNFVVVFIKKHASLRIRLLLQKLR